MSTLLAPNTLNSVAYPRGPLLLMNDESDAVVVAERFHQFTVFVPSDYGGRLTIGIRAAERSDDQIIIVASADGHHAEVDAVKKIAIVEIPEGRRGSGTFEVSVLAPSGHFAIYALFDESGHAREANGDPLIPWNFWYFPFSNAEEPSLTAWDSQSYRPFQKYEEAFGVVGAFDWEREHHADSTHQWPLWAGHCHDAATASIVFDSPHHGGVEKNGVTFGHHEVKLLATECVGKLFAEKNVWDLPDEPIDPSRPENTFKTLKPSEEPAAFGARVLVGFLTMLRVHVRDRGDALRVDFGDWAGRYPQAVWNHAVFRYKTRYSQVEAGYRGVVRASTVVCANADLPEDDVGDKGMPAVYVPGRREFRMHERSRSIGVSSQLEFDEQGQLVEGSPYNEWTNTQRAIPTGKGFTFSDDLFAPRDAFSVMRPRLPKLPPGITYPGYTGNPIVQEDHVFTLCALREGFR